MPFTVDDLADAYDLDAFAAAIHVSRRTAERIVARKEVEYVRIGSGRGHIRVPRRAADNYVNRHAVTRPRF